MLRWVLIRFDCWLYIYRRLRSLLCRRLLYVCNPFRRTVTRVGGSHLGNHWIHLVLVHSFFSPIYVAFCILLWRRLIFYPLVEIWISMDPNGSSLQVINLTKASGTALIYVAVYVFDTMQAICADLRLGSLSAWPASHPVLSADDYQHLKELLRTGSSQERFPATTQLTSRGGACKSSRSYIKSNQGDPDKNVTLWVIVVSVYILKSCPCLIEIYSMRKPLFCCFTFRLVDSRALWVRNIS